MEISWEDRDSLKYGLKSLQKGMAPLLEASHCHLLVTPPSHFKLQKVRGFVGRFFVNEGKIYSPKFIRAAYPVKRIFRPGSDSNFRQKIMGNPSILGVVPIY